MKTMNLSCRTWKKPMRMAPHINLQSPDEKMGERDSKDSHVDDSVGDVDDEHGEEVESLFVHQREVEEEGDRQGNLDNDHFKVKVRRMTTVSIMMTKSKMDTNVK